MSTTPACPVRGVCLSPGPCANAAGCILTPTETPASITLTRRQQDAERLYGPLYPWPLRKDTHARAGLPEVFA